MDGNWFFRNGPFDQEEQEKVRSFMTQLRELRWAVLKIWAFAWSVLLVSIFSLIAVVRIAMHIF